jgi:hypothetical protein
VTRKDKVGPPSWLGWNWATRAFPSITFAPSLSRFFWQAPPPILPQPILPPPQVKAPLGQPPTPTYLIHRPILPLVYAQLSSPLPLRIRPILIACLCPLAFLAVRHFLRKSAIFHSRPAVLSAINHPPLISLLRIHTQPQPCPKSSEA